MMLRLWIYIFKHVESRRDKIDEEAYALGAVLLGGNTVGHYSLGKRRNLEKEKIEEGD